MSITAPGEVKQTSVLPGNIWKCHVCGFISRSEKPPAECPQCASTSREFEEISDKTNSGMTGKSSMSFSSTAAVTGRTIQDT